MKGVISSRFRKFTSGILTLAMVASIVAPIGNVVHAAEPSNPMVGSFSSDGPTYVSGTYPGTLITKAGSNVSAIITDPDSNMAGCEYTVNMTVWNPTDDTNASWTGSTNAGTCTLLNVGSAGMNMSYTYTLRGTDILGYVGTGSSQGMIFDGELPTSSADTGLILQNTSNISVPFTAADSVSDIQQVELFFRKNGGSWTSAGTGTTSPFAFDAATHGGTGTYDFYTIATDNVENAEVKGSPSPERTVSFDDRVPTVSLYGGVSVDTVIGEVYTDSGAEWSDPTDGTGNTLNTTFVLSGSVNTGSLGTYTLEYIKVNTAGNTGTISRTVNVVPIPDTNAPVLGTWFISPSYLSGGVIYHPSENVTFSTTVTDDDTGINSCKLSIMGGVTIKNGSFTPDGSTNSGTCSYTFTTGGNIIGAPSYPYQWVVTDVAGNTITGSVLSSPTPTGDFDSPVSAASGTLTVYSFSGTSVDLPFTATDSGAYRSGLNHLDLYSAFDGGMWTLVQTYGSGELDTETTLPYTFTHGTGTYEFYTVVTDNVGNTETKTPTTEATVSYLDLAPPTTTVTSFPTVNIANSGAVTLTGTCTDGTGDDVTLVISDQNPMSPDISNSAIMCNVGIWAYNSIDLTSLVDSTLTATVTQTNVAGTTSTGNTRTTTKDTVAPVDPTNLSIPYDSTYIINFANSGSLLVTGDSETGATIQGVVDGVDVPTTAGPLSFESFGLSLTHELIGLTTGANYSTPKIFTFKVTDAAGNVHYTSSGISFTKDTALPTASISYNPASLTNSSVIATLTGISESITVTNNGASTTYIFTDTGSFTFEYEDAAGNTGSTTATVTWIDKVAPTIAEITPIDALGTDSTPNYTFSSTKSGTISYSGSCSSPTVMIVPGNTTITLNSLADNTYTNCSITVEDDAGNVSNALIFSPFTIDATPPTVSISTSPVTIDANAYLIQGTVTSGTGGVTITGGLTTTTAPIDGSGAFRAMVYLTQNTTNALVVSALDTAGNIGTGSVVITESGSTNDYANAIVVTVADLPYVATIGTSGTGASNIAFQTPVIFNPTGNIRVTISAGTTIRETSENPFDYSTLGATNATVSSGIGTNEVSNGAIEFGISGVGLNFTKPVKVEIPVTGMTSGTIPVKVKHGGTSTFVTTGLTNNPSLTCDNGRVYSGSTISANLTETNIATVSAGVATIYTCAASIFTTYSTITPSNGGGGGGGSFIASITPTTASTGVIVTLSGSTKSISSSNTTVLYAVTIEASELRKARVKRISFPTALGAGTVITVYRVLRNGKKVKVGSTRVLRNGKFIYNFRQAGNFEFIQN